LVRIEAGCTCEGQEVKKYLNNYMINIDRYIKSFSTTFPGFNGLLPWKIVIDIFQLLQSELKDLGPDFIIKEGIAIHKDSVIEQGVILKAPVIIGEKCFIGANAYLRGGVYLGKGSKIGTSCEVKSSIIMQNSGIAHFNFIGDSIIGSNVNFEAGSITANHFNERTEKEISVVIDSIMMKTGVVKFGALVGDNSKIGANAVLSPGTILNPESIVGRLELVDQSKL
jgi:UDP-N-acetylglucosamine diphosphorylase / glucose-1-phosphate thymidylyltransferase / UDP-N-acetylgalactosamine diphosphorylase / glucosamine-1-phosphate N-acetyltransferase / galactosamine-1-phosphate N-acetyltransferase